MQVCVCVCVGAGKRTRSPHEVAATKEWSRDPTLRTASPAQAKKASYAKAVDLGRFRSYSFDP